MMVHALPERRGYIIAHDHEEGEPCRVRCHYLPTLWTRLRKRLGR